MQIIENLLAKNHFSYVEQRLTDPAIHWYYLPWTADQRDSGPYSGSFSHLIWRDGEAVSPLWECCLSILLAACDQQNLKLESVERVRLGMITRTPEYISHSPHIDQATPHRTGIFYPITADGPTVLYRERAVYGDPDIPKTWTPEHRQDPTANLWMDFDGRVWHSSTTPVLSERRLVLNFNYVAT